MLRDHKMQLTPGNISYFNTNSLEKHKRDKASF